MNKIKSAVIKQLHEADLKAANAWVLELVSLWELSSPFKGDWIEPAELYDFGDTLVVGDKPQQLSARHHLRPSAGLAGVCQLLL